MTEERQNPMGDTFDSGSWSRTAYAALESARAAEGIVRSLARVSDNDLADIHDDNACVLCASVLVIGEGVHRSHTHSESCPARLARVWVSENPEPRAES